MIISDKYRFVFVHIPKCAGTTIRRILQDYDDADGAYTRRVGEHQYLGSLDYVHIPLFSLKKHFQHDFDKIISYWSFSVVRDPFSRFSSSVSQRLSMYGAAQLKQLTDSEIKAEIDQTISYLSGLPRQHHQLPAEYIHFQRQVDYVFLDGKQLVEKIYLIDDIENLLGDVSRYIEHKLEIREGEQAGRANETMVYRSDLLRKVIELVRPMYHQISGILPNAAMKRFRPLLYVTRDKRFNALFESEYILDFVRDYYSEDIGLFESVRGTEKNQGIGV